MSAYVGLSEAHQRAIDSRGQDGHERLLQCLRRGELVAFAETYDQDVTRERGTTRCSERGLDKRTAQPIPQSFWIASGGKVVPKFSESSVTSDWVEIDPETLTRTTITARATGIYLAAAEVDQFFGASQRAPMEPGRHSKSAAVTTFEAIVATERVTKDTAFHLMVEHHPQLSRRAFDKIWAEHAPAEWKNHGRPSKRR